MKNYFQKMWATLMVVMLCVTTFLSCSTKEEYEFEFELPGRIVTQLGASVVVSFKAVNISSMSVTSVPEGWEVKDVDLVKRTMTIVAPKEYTTDDNNVEENGLLKMTGFTAAGTSLPTSSYLSLQNRSIDLTAQHSNSYVISQKDTRYTIDVIHKGETDERIAPAKVDVVWQSEVYLVDYDSYDAEKGTYTFYVSSKEVEDANGNVESTTIPYGNAVVGAYDENDNIIWSWHLWLTSEVEEITTASGVFMDRNLGAHYNGGGSTDTDDIYASYGLYYQWGRKEPFPRPKDYNFSNNQDQKMYSGGGATKTFRYVTYEMVKDQASAFEFGSREYATAYPFTYILGTEANDFDWLHGEHDAALWTESDKKKSVNDPCPYGWRVPDGDAFVGFDIDEAEDAAAVADVKNMYGWHLVDNNGVKMFMPGAGRRSYENGVLTNVNNYGYEHNPMPWIGYYWTAGAVGGNKSQSMFFDLNTTRAVNNRYEAQKDMYRGNGMQVRCVKVK